MYGRIGTFLAGMVAGFLLDPANGSKRRSKVRTQLEPVLRRVLKYKDAAIKEVESDDNPIGRSASRVQHRAAEVSDSVKHAAEHGRQTTLHIADQGRQTTLHAVDEAKDAAVRATDRARDRSLHTVVQVKHAGVEAAEQAKETTAHTLGQAKEVVLHAADQAKQAATYAAEEARQTAAQATDQARHTAMQAAERVRQAAGGQISPPSSVGSQVAAEDSGSAPEAEASVPHISPADVGPADIADPIPEGNPNDPTLTSRIESVLFRDDSIPKAAINIDAASGVVTLRGTVKDGVADEIVARTRSIDGVLDVVNLLKEE